MGELEAAGFDLPETALAWPSDLPRRAAVNSFGFSGNNAHLILEAWQANTASISIPHTPLSSEEIALCGMGVVAGEVNGISELAKRWFSPEDGSPSPPLKTVQLPLAGVGFPPTDLEASLGQQTSILQAANEAVGQLKTTLSKNTGVFVGMGCDTTTVLHALRLRISNADGEAWRERNREAAPPLTAARVLGTMPNLPANRLHAQRDLHGFGFTVASKECSGIDALKIAFRALRAGELDTAVVGTVDLSHEPGHLAAMRQVLGKDSRDPGDAAIVLLLKTRQQAERDGDRIIALLSDLPNRTGSEESISLRSGSAGPVTARFGHAHAASGLLHVAAAALSVNAHARVDREGAWPWIQRSPRVLLAEVESFAGKSAAIAVSSAEAAGPIVYPVHAPQIMRFSAASNDDLLRAMDGDTTIRPGPVRLALFAYDESSLQQLLQSAARSLRAGVTPKGPGVLFASSSTPGEMAFTFTGAAAGYDGMGRELLLAWPEIGSYIADRMTVAESIGRMMFGADTDRLVEWSQLSGAVMLSMAHGRFTRFVLHLKPQAALGLSSGETNALIAFEAWNDLDETLLEFQKSGLYGEWLTGKYRAAKLHWHMPEDQPIIWRNYRIAAPVREVEAALATEPLTYMTIVQGPADCVIGGAADACERVLAAVGKHRAMPLGLDMIVHCAAMKPCAEQWRRIHSRRVTPVPGVRFYTHATNQSYALTQDAVADALTRQALQPISFPACLESAWQDGVRIFVEHGPRPVLTNAVSQILGDRPHLALALDRRENLPLRSLTETTLALWVHGQPCNIQEFEARLNRIRQSRQQQPTNGHLLTLSAHRTPLCHAADLLAQAPDRELPEQVPSAANEQRASVMVPSPSTLPVIPGWASIWKRFSGVQTVVPPQIVRVAATAQQCSLVVSAFQGIAEVQREYIQQQVETHTAVLRFHERHTQFPARAERVQLPRADHLSEPENSTLARVDPAKAAPRFTRLELEHIATGRIADVFGESFASQALYARQVRMPAPPMLLVDRVLLLEGTPHSMGTGRIITETDVVSDAWYLHAGHMIPGALIEAGQADLLLISWLGVDMLNRGERVYRLLGCEMTFQGPLPKPGETLRYDIRISGHAQMGGIRLFFFDYSCVATGTDGERPVLSVRNGQAGFFTDQELQSSGGILWDAVSDTPAPDAVYSRPSMPSLHRSFSNTQVQRLVMGDAFGCFGRGFESIAAHRQTPTLPTGRCLLIDRVVEFAAEGGPWGRGYLRAEADVPQDAWFYQGHFHNDPCMPGTLMAEGATQAVAFLMGAMGLTIPHDGWRFEPVPDAAQTFLCRGQVIPDRVHRLEYEVFVEELKIAPVPSITAAILCRSDGIKVFHCRSFGLQLTPDYPDLHLPDVEPRTVGDSGDVRGDEAAMLACAFGRPSISFGSLYLPFDGGRRAPRLPAPPYHFVSRVLSVTGDPGVPKAGGACLAEYDVPADAWYFKDGRGSVMPFAVLIEVALQPCGWLSSYMGFALEIPGDAMFRNLDGSSVRAYKQVTPGTGVLTIASKLTRFAKAGGSTIVFFDVQVRAGDEPVLTLTTSFGFFGQHALDNQAGLPFSEEQRAAYNEPWHGDVINVADLAAQKGCALVSGPMRMLDSITGLWPTGGTNGLGRIRGRQSVDPTAWFFKAHFFQDPVQPGSLGLEALTQLLQVFARLSLPDAKILTAHFGPAAFYKPLTWKFRGQVRPQNVETTTLLDIVAITPLEDGSTVLEADGSFWVDGVPIYSLQGLNITLISG